MVAPSFQTMKIVGETYTKNGKQYVDVKNEKTGNIRSVRWYSDTEYAKNYGKKLSDDNANWNMKHARGFDKGPILVIRGTLSTDEEWLKTSCARYAVGIGWHIISTDIFPANAPAHFKYLLLSWDEFKADDRHAKKATELTEILNKKAKNKEWIKINE